MRHDSRLAQAGVLVPAPSGPHILTTVRAQTPQVQGSRRSRARHAVEAGADACIVLISNVSIHNFVDNRSRESIALRNCGQILLGRPQPAICRSLSNCDRMAGRILYKRPSGPPSAPALLCMLLRRFPGAPPVPPGSRRDTGSSRSSSC
jgi:hypothetical protein